MRKRKSGRRRGKRERRRRTRTRRSRVFVSRIAFNKNICDQKRRRTLPAFLAVMRGTLAVMRGTLASLFYYSTLPNIPKLGILFYYSTNTPFLISHLLQLLLPPVIPVLMYAEAAHRHMAYSPKLHTESKDPVQSLPPRRKREALSTSFARGLLSSRLPCFACCIAARMVTRQPTIGPSRSSKVRSGNGSDDKTATGSKGPEGGVLEGVGGEIRLVMPRRVLAFSSSRESGRSSSSSLSSTLSSSTPMRGGSTCITTLPAGAAGP